MSSVRIRDRMYEYGSLVKNWSSSFLTVDSPSEDLGGGYTSTSQADNADNFMPITPIRPDGKGRSVEMSGQFRSLTSYASTHNAITQSPVDRDYFDFELVNEFSGRYRRRLHCDGR